LAVAGMSCGYLEVFFSRPPRWFAEVKGGDLGKQTPADACGAICLSFRTLGRFS
jgi:hypothetical protein